MPPAAGRPAPGGEPIGQHGKTDAVAASSARTTRYHCDRLEAAGPMLQERHGQSVLVSRTARGANWSTCSVCT
jgi:hypothetical protein